MHLVHASSFPVYNARIRKSHQEHAAEHKERRTCTAGVRKFGAEGIGEDDAAVLAVLNLTIGGYVVIDLSAVHRIAHRATTRHIGLGDGVLGAIWQVVNDHVFIGLELEGALTTLNQLGRRASIRCVAHDRIVIDKRIAVGVGQREVKRELQVLVGGANDLLLDLQLTGVVGDRNGGHRRQGELHVAARSGKTALGIEEGKLVLAFRTLSDVIPQVHIFAERTVNATEIAHESGVALRISQENPHIVIAEEVVFQRTNIVVG